MVEAPKGVPRNQKSIMDMFKIKAPVKEIKENAKQTPTKKRLLTLQTTELGEAPLSRSQIQKALHRLDTDILDESVNRHGINTAKAAAMRPSFIRAENIMDINRRRPGDPEYDPGSIYVPK